MPSHTSPTRENWLLTGVDRLRPLFRAQGHEVPEVKVSVGWPATGQRSPRRRQLPGQQVALLLGPLVLLLPQHLVLIQLVNYTSVFNINFVKIQTLMMEHMVRV